MEFKKKRKKDTNIDITPLVDTVFILLIFFALSLNFTKVTSLNIHLPEISTNSALLKNEEIVIKIDRDEKIYLYNKTVDNITTLRKRLSLYKSCRNKTVVIEADANVRHGKVVEIMDAVQHAGINNITIAAFIK